MPTYDEIIDGDISLEDILTSSLNDAIDNSSFELQILSENNGNLSDADDLIEQIFPRSEAEDYKPSQIYQNDDASLCIAILSGGVVYGCINVSFHFDENEPTMVVHCLAVDKDYRRQKLGSMLLLAAHDIAYELGMGSVALISSNSGQRLYESFGFETQAHQSYIAALPFDDKIINSKIAAFEQAMSSNRFGMYIK